MKSNVLLLVEQAGWPSLLVDEIGIVRHRNKMAVALFGTVLSAHSSKLSTIWSPENSTSAERFFAQWEASPSLFVPLKFRGENDASSSWLGAVSTCVVEKQKYFLLQLLPDNTQGAAAARTPTTDANLAHKQKLDCALQMARTVSLDFNNALTTILGHTSLVLSKIEPNHPWRHSLLEVEKSAARAAEIASDLGAFSRQEKDSCVQASGNLNSLLQRCVEFFQQSPGPEPIYWELQLERNLFGAKFDELKLQQAFLRVLENAVQALRGHGSIIVQTRNFELSEPAQDRNLRLAAGAHVCVEISDNGSGIEPDILPRIFEPFFTTKRDKKHRGLGLAWVYGILTTHGGGVAVSSQPGSGTSVRLYLPSDKRIIKHNSVAPNDLNGHECVLVVDDEELILTMGQTILSAYGYKVLTANSGQKALDILSQSADTIDLVITDLVMPGMSGRELIEHIQAFSPRTRIICTSGYAWPKNSFEDGVYLQKPFTSSELLLKVKQSLIAE